MMDFPITDLMDERACYDWLVDLLHPGGLACPRCGGTDAFVHRYVRDPVLDYRCKGCGAVYNAFTATDWQKTHFRPSQIALILRGFAQGRSTAGLARELGCSRGHLLERRHTMQARALAAAEAGATPLPDGTVEADEMDQNAGEKRRPAHRPRRPAAAARQ
jgi:transposase-like protein